MAKVVVSFLILWSLIVGLVLTQERSAGASHTSSEDALSRAGSSGILPSVLQSQENAQNGR